MSGRYYPNNCDEIARLSDDEFESCTYEELMIAISLIRPIPSSHSCLMRVENTDTGKIKEYAYRTNTGACKRIIKLVDDPANVITIIDNEQTHLLIHPDNDTIAN